ncbi:MAG: cell division protein FtsZ [Tannerellaceae bacterium]|jgi:cell division protein FtsZ|nr:cell division protein FtsZ [Tannerellaceae bacterium]
MEEKVLNTDEGNLITFVYGKDNSLNKGPNIIKVVGVGGGGGNAVGHMYEEGIQDVSFVLCNTDKQALDRSPVPQRIVLGRTVTQGLGAGNQPLKAKHAAEESREEIYRMLDDGTKMAFITAGMGGGTGTGAAPVIAGIARDMGILTVGIVTIPFLFEGKRKILQALNGVEEIAQNVDALLVINNEKLRDIYADLTVINAFKKADSTLTVAARSIAEIITQNGVINLDFADVETTMKDGGVALMSNGFGEGEERVRIALEDALHSPLLGNKDVRHARRILLNVCCNEESPLLMEEMGYINAFMNKFNPDEVDVIWGYAIDNSLGKQIKVTLLATGFTVEDVTRGEFTRNEEEEERQRKEQQEQDLIGRYYGELDRMGRRPNFVVLTDDELDDDNLIALLEDNPPLSRPTKLIPSFRKPPVSQ